MPISSPKEGFAYKRLACLVMIFSGVPENPDTGRRFEFNPESGPEWSIGSDITDHIQLDSEVASPYHAQLSIKAKQWKLSNMQSKREIFANRLPVSRHQVQDGDIVDVRKAIFKFFSGKGPDAVYAHTLYERGIIDPLMGIYDRGFFDENLLLEYKRCARHEQPIALLVMDLDKCKDINTTYGLQRGDEVLKQVTKRITQSRIRGDEIFARCGGEERALILPGAKREDACEIGEQIRPWTANTTVTYKDQTIQVTLSVGWVPLLHLKCNGAWMNINLYKGQAYA